MGASAVLAVIMKKEREIIEAFERAGATSPDSARPLDTMAIDADGLGMRRLRDRAVIREAAPGRYYLDVEVLQALRRLRRRLSVVVILGIVLPLLLLLLTVGLAR